MAGWFWCSHDAELAQVKPGGWGVREGGGYDAAIVYKGLGRAFAHLITYSLLDIGRTTILFKNEKGLA